MNDKDRKIMEANAEYNNLKMKDLNINDKYKKFGGLYWILEVTFFLFVLALFISCFIIAIIGIIKGKILFTTALFLLCLFMIYIIFKLVKVIIKYMRMLF